MDINSRLKWTPGTVLTAGAMVNFDDNHELKQLLTIRAALGHRFGLMPNMTFNADGFFVDGSYEIPHLRCTAVLPSGMTVDVDEPVTVPMPGLGPGLYYLCAGYSSEEVTFEKGELTFSRPGYEYSVKTLEQVVGEDVIPLVRFRISDGECSVEPDFIPPCLLMSCDARLLGFRDRFVSSIQELIAHRNMRDRLGKYDFGRYFLHLQGISTKNTVDHFLQVCGELANALRFFVRQSVEEGTEESVPQPSSYDVEKWLSWLESELKASIEYMDGLELEDEGIDVDALMAQIEARLAEKLTAELSESLGEKLREVLKEDVNARIDDVLKEYMDGTFRASLHDAVKSELSDELSGDLFDKLYQSLYEALYTPPEKEEDNYLPLI